MVIQGFFGHVVRGFEDFASPSYFLLHNRMGHSRVSPSLPTAYLFVKSRCVEGDKRALPESPGSYIHANVIKL